MSDIAVRDQILRYADMQRSFYEEKGRREPDSGVVGHYDYHENCRTRPICFFATAMYASRFFRISARAPFSTSLAAKGACRNSSAKRMVPIPAPAPHSDMRLSRRWGAKSCSTPLAVTNLESRFIGQQWLTVSAYFRAMREDFGSGFYLLRAIRLVAIAQEVADPRIRVQLLEMASEFRRLAEFVAINEPQPIDDDA